jgi:hypothetical protein
MFDAMKGLKEALAAKERLPEPRKELAQDAAEELNRALCSLEVGMFICSATPLRNAKIAAKRNSAYLTV